MDFKVSLVANLVKKGNRQRKGTTVKYLMNDCVLLLDLLFYFNRTGFFFHTEYKEILCHYIDSVHIIRTDSVTLNVSG